MESEGQLVRQIKELKLKKNAVILAHNYQRKEVQEIADYVEDSLGLARKSLKVSAEVIVICGNRFMAETVKILSRKKLVLLPRRQSGCPMADTITPEDIMRLRSENPRATSVCGVHVDASVKAQCDICCTSSNVLEVVNKLDQEEIILIPDSNLASWVSRHSTKKIISWSGFCFVHERIDCHAIDRAKGLHPDAPVIVHPGCKPEVIELADEVLSTEGMVRFSTESTAQEIIVGSEEGLVHRLYRENPHKTFYTAGTARMCTNMKITHLVDVLGALQEETHRVELPEEVIVRVGKNLGRMFELCGEAH